MATDKEPKTPSEFLDRLGEFFMERPEETTEELRARLRDQGVDPDQVIARVRQLVDAKAKEARLAWREKAQQERFAASQLLEGVRLSGKWTREQLIERIREFLAASAGATLANAQAHFRNFERLTDNDLRSLIEDFERTAALEGQSELGPKGNGDVNV